MANRAVALYQSIKVQGKWTMRKAPQRKKKLTVGQYFVSWYEGSRKRMEPVGPEPDVALTSLRKKKAELNFVAAGGQPSEQQHKRDCETIRQAVEAYLDDCRARQGKSGYGMAKTTVDAYRYRLGFLTEFSPNANVDEVDLPFVRALLKFLRSHSSKLGDRSCYNVIQAASTFLRTCGITVATDLLRQMSFPPKPIIAYSDAEMTGFFKACDDEERLILKFFLHSMAREREVAFCEVRDLLFGKNVLHTSPESFRGADHLRQILEEAQTIVSDALAASDPREKS